MHCDIVCHSANWSAAIQDGNIDSSPEKIQLLANLTGKAAKDDSNTWISVTNVGDLDQVPESWFWPECSLSNTWVPVDHLGDLDGVLIWTCSGCPYMAATQRSSNLPVNGRSKPPSLSIALSNIYNKCHSYTLNFYLREKWRERGEEEVEAKTWERVGEWASRRVTPICWLAHEKSATARVSPKLATVSSFQDSCKNGRNPIACTITTASHSLY